jgi:flavin-dependent dehydrogenase
MQVDIIGGGLSGLATALSLKHHDPSIRVIVHEKHKEIGFNIDARRCGEAHHIEQGWKQWIPDKDSICSEIRQGITNTNKRKLVSNVAASTAWVLDRPKFIHMMGEKAEDLNVEIETSRKISDIAGLDGDFIVDASGVPSIVKRQLGMKNLFIGNSYQQTLQECNVFLKGTVQVFFDKRIGYFWIFPRDIEKKEVNIGIGFLRIEKQNLKSILEEFKEKQGITGKITHVTGGLIPFGLQPPLIYKNILFVGDAGVGTFPFNGQGIYRALISGDIAGKCIASGHPQRYKNAIYKEFMKWDIIGKGFLIYNKLLYRYGKAFVVPSWRLFYEFYNIIHTNRIH